MKHINQEIPIRTVSVQFNKKQQQNKKMEMRKALCYSSNYKKRCMARSTAQQDYPLLTQLRSQESKTNCKTMSCTPMLADSAKQSIVHKGSCKEIRDSFIEKLGVDGRVRNKVPKKKKSEPVLPQFETIITQTPPQNDNNEKKERNGLKKKSSLTIAAQLKSNKTCRSSINQKEISKQKKQKQIYKTNQINLSSPFASYQYINSFPIAQKITMSSLNKLYEICVKDFQEVELRNRVIKTQGKVQGEKKSSLQKNEQAETQKKRALMKQVQVHKTAKIFKQYDDILGSNDFTKSITVKRKKLDPTKQQQVKNLRQSRIQQKREEKKMKEYKKRKSCTLEDDFMVNGWEGIKDFQEQNSIFQNV